MAVDFKSIGTFHLGALAAGGLSLILSFFPRYMSASGGSGAFKVSAGTNAWTSYATLGILLVLVATALVAATTFAADALPAGIPWNLIALATSGLGTLLIILRALTGSESVFGVSVGPGWSGWLLFISTIALTAFIALIFKSSGEKLPEFKKDGPSA